MKVGLSSTLATSEEQFLRLPFAPSFVDLKAGYCTFAVKLATYCE